jgi:hypothetical protein
MTGTVVRGSFGAGSKSERDAIWLDTGDRRLVLRRKEGPAFGDRALEQYVGQRVTCDGFIIGYSLLAERITAVT